MGRWRECAPLRLSQGCLSAQSPRTLWAVVLDRDGEAQEEVGRERARPFPDAAIWALELAVEWRQRLVAETKPRLSQVEPRMEMMGQDAAAAVDSVTGERLACWVPDLGEGTLEVVVAVLACWVPDLGEGTLEVVAAVLAARPNSSQAQPQAQPQAQAQAQAQQAQAQAQQALRKREPCAAEAVAVLRDFSSG